MKPARIVVAVSGAGRSLANLMVKQAGQNWAIVGVIASRAEIGACELARKAHLPLLVANFSRKKIAKKSVQAFLEQVNADWVVLAGFLKIFPDLKGWKQRIINIHPALLPAFGGQGMYGERVHSAVIASRSLNSGASVHFVTSRYDEGQIIAQARVPVLADDDAKALSTRVFSAECQLLPAVISALVRKELPLPDQKIWILGEDSL